MIMGDIRMPIGKKIFSTISHILIVCILIFTTVFLIIFLNLKFQIESQKEDLHSLILDKTQSAYNSFSEKALYGYTNLFVKEKNERLEKLSNNINDMASFATNLYHTGEWHDIENNYNLLPDVSFESVENEMGIIYPLETFFEGSNSSIFEKANLYYCSESGFLLNSQIKTGEKNIDIDLHDRDWYKNTKTSGEVIWSIPYYDFVTNNITLTCSKAVYNQYGDFAGAVGMDFKGPSFLQQDTSGFNLDRTKLTEDFSDYLIIDSAGNIILSSKGLSSDPSYLSDEMADKIIASCLLANKKDDVSIAHVDNFTIACADLAVNGWQICFILDPTFIDTSVERIDTSVQVFSDKLSKNLNDKILLFIIVLLISLGVMALLCIFISKKLTKSFTDPIGKLSHGIKRMGIGNLNERVEIAGNSELSELAEIINNVSNSLKESMHQVAIESAQNQQLLKESEISQAIQTGMPPAELNYPNVEVAGFIQPARDVGGDFYNYFLTDAGKLGFVMGEISNNGVGAALFMSYAKGMLESITKTSESPAKAMQKANQCILERNHEQTPVSAIIGFLDMDTYNLNYVTAGCMAPILKTSRSVKKLKNSKAAPLGTKKNASYKTITYEMNPSEALILYTGGVNLPSSPLRKGFSEESLINLIRKTRFNSADEICAALLHKMKVRCKHYEQKEDITLSVIRIRNDTLYKKISNTIGELKDYLAELSDFIDNNNVSRSYFVLLTIEEILVNIIKHGSKKKCTIEIHLETFKGRNKITIIDDSFAFDPGSLEDPNVTSVTVENRVIGGLGIYIIKKISKEMTYKRKDNKNINTIII